MIVPPSSAHGLSRLLLVEDNPGDAHLVRELLLDMGVAALGLEVAGTLAEALRLLDGDGFDAVLLDLMLPDSTGLDTLERVVARWGSIPVIVLTGAGGDDLGVRAMAAGAADFLPKGELTGRLLLRSLRYAVERTRRHGVEARYRALVESSRDLVSILDETLSIRYVSPSLRGILGYDPEEKLQGDAALEVHPDDQEKVGEEVRRILEDPGYVSRLHYRVRHRDGGWRILDTVVQNCFDDPHIRGLVVNSRDITELREIERAASETARRLERTLGALEDAVFTLDRSGGTILDCNAAAESMFGWGREEMLGDSTGMLHVDEASWRRYVEESDLALHHGEAYRAELPMRRRDGSSFPAGITVTLLDPTRGAGGGVVVVLRDLTEQVERARQVRFQAALLQHVGQPILAVDEEGRLTYWNPAAEALTGWSREEVEGREIARFLVPETDLPTAMLAREVAQKGGRWRGELAIRKKDGGEVIVQATTTPGVNPDGTPGGRIAAGVDITELRRAEEESRRAMEQVRFQADLLEAVGQAVVATDLDGRIIYWNRAAEELYGWSREEALGRPVLDVTPSGGSRQGAGEILERLRRGEAWTGEMDLRRRDGSLFHALVTDAPLLDDDGRLVGIIGVSSDITQRRELEDQLRQAQKMEAVGRLAGGVAHDFNNMLTAIEGHASMLLAELAASSPLRGEVEEILRAGRRAADLTRQLLAFSRRQVLEERTVDLARVAEELKVMLERLVPENIDFRMDVGAGGAVVRADPSQLQQVVMNLVLNAVDAVDGEGAVTLAVEAMDLSAEEARAIPWHIDPGPYVRLTVEDTGVGIPPEVLDQIFEPFFTTKPEGHGTGLGLSTVYGIVKQSGGHVLVDSVPGRGTTFRVLLPRRSGAPEPAREESGADGQVGEGVVLLVEDDASVRSIARRILERAGYTVIEAAQGREALVEVQSGEHAIDLVISDVVMPDMGGVELQKRLKEVAPGLKVVLTSGYSEVEVRDEIRQMGAAFLSKPFTPTGLLRCVAGALAEER